MFIGLTQILNLDKSVEENKMTESDLIDILTHNKQIVMPLLMILRFTRIFFYYGELQIVHIFNTI